MLKETISLRNYAHIGDSVWEVFVRTYTIYKTSNSKLLHKITTERVNATFQKEMLAIIDNELTEDEHELARRARNLPIPILAFIIFAVMKRAVKSILILTIK